MEVAARQRQEQRQREKAKRQRKKQRGRRQMDRRYDACGYDIRCILSHACVSGPSFVGIQGRGTADTGIEQEGTGSNKSKSSMK